MANTLRDGAKERRWRERLERQRSSSVTVRGFCQREGCVGSAERRGLGRLEGLRLRLSPRLP